jgi:hypothetical protein
MTVTITVAVRTVQRVRLHAESITGIPLVRSTKAVRMSEKFRDEFTMIMMMAVTAIIIYGMICFAFGG